jgi:hypothetical protein
VGAAKVTVWVALTTKLRLDRLDAYMVPLTEPLATSILSVQVPGAKMVRVVPTTVQTAASVVV